MGKMNRSKNPLDHIIQKSLTWIRQLKKETLLVVFLSGILLLVIVWPTSESAGHEKDDGTIMKEKQEEYKDTTQEESLQDYQRRMEQQLTEMLEHMAGVGDVDVMITVEDAGKIVVEKDIQQSISEQSQDSREETVYEEDELGQQPFVVNTLTPRIKGVLIAASHGDDAKVKAEVLEAVKALFQLESHKISIVKRK